MEQTVPGHRDPRLGGLLRIQGALRNARASAGSQWTDISLLRLLQIPFIRDLWLWTSCVDASKSVAANVLRHHLSELVYPGGTVTP